MKLKFHIFKNTSFYNMIYYNRIRYKGTTPVIASSSVVNPKKAMYGNIPAIETIYNQPTPPGPDPEYTDMYFTIESLENNNEIQITIGSSVNTSHVSKISYSLDNGSTWTHVTNIDSQEVKSNKVYINQGDRMMFKGDISRSKYSGDRIEFATTKKFDVYGNVLSLVNNAPTGDSLNNNSQLYGLLMNTNVVNAENLVMPSRTVADDSLGWFFYGCQYLETAPELPATTLFNSTGFGDRGCYNSMFNGCTSLIKAPYILPATLIGERSYYCMFKDCSSLVYPPVISATTTYYSSSYANYGMAYMFKNCSSLISAPALSITMMQGYIYCGMFENCTSLVQSPILIATTLDVDCYAQMFKGCTSLNRVTCLATDISATNCLLEWLDGVASSGTLYKDSSMNGFVVGTNVPSNWTISNYN